VWLVDSSKCATSGSEGRVTGGSVLRGNGVGQRRLQNAVVSKWPERGKSVLIPSRHAA
jgi:hypothetical protein